MNNLQWNFSHLRAHRCFRLKSLIEIRKYNNHDLLEMVQKNEEMIKVLANKVETLEKALGYQQCFEQTGNRGTKVQIG